MSSRLSKSGAILLFGTSAAAALYVIWTLYSCEERKSRRRNVKTGQKFSAEADDELQMKLNVLRNGGTDESPARVSRVLKDLIQASVYKELRNEMCRLGCIGDLRRLVQNFDHLHPDVARSVLHLLTNLANSPEYNLEIQGAVAPDLLQLYLKKRSCNRVLIDDLLEVLVNLSLQIENPGDVDQFLLTSLFDDATRYSNLMAAKVLVNYSYCDVLAVEIMKNPKFIELLKSIIADGNVDIDDPMNVRFAYLIRSVLNSHHAKLHEEADYSVANCECALTHRNIYGNLLTIQQFIQRFLN